MKEIRKDVPFYLLRNFTEQDSFKYRSLDYYMAHLGNFFDRLECVSKYGSFLSDGGFEWIAYGKHIEGHDDVYTGYGSSPYEAIKDLYRESKGLMRYSKPSETGISQIFIDD